MGGIATFTLTIGKSLKLSDYKVILLLTHFKGDYWDAANVIFDESISFEVTQNPLVKIFKIIRYVNRLKPEVLIINNCPLVNYSLPFITRKTCTLSVIHSNDRSFYLYDSRFSGWLDYLSCPSSRVAETLHSFLPHKDTSKTIYIPHGISFPKYSFHNFKIRNSMIFAGNLDKHKGIKLLPSVLEMVTMHFPDAKLHVVGKGPLQKWLIEEIKSKKLYNNFECIPELKRDELFKKFSKMEILLLPTRIESFGLVIPESMSMGVIPVISRLEKITDQFVHQGDNGFLCDMDFPAEFSANIIRILSDPELKNKMSVRSKEIALGSFSDSLMTERYIEAFNRFKEKKKPMLFSPSWIYLFIKDILRIIYNILNANKYSVYR